MVNDIAVQEFVNAIKEDPQDTNKTYNATVSRVDKEGIVWVNIHGSDKETPTASTSTEVKRGDSVVVNWRNNKLYIGGNYTNPSAGIGTVQPSIDYINDLVANSITVNSINAATGYIEDLTSKNITTENLAADHATIKELDVESMAAATAYIRDLTAENITAEDIIADHATVGTIAADYVSTGDLEAVTGRIDDLETNELVVNDNLKANNASIEYLESDWISTDRLVLTGNNKNNYPPVQITESEFNVNKTAYWTKSGDTYTQCTQQSVYDPDEQYYVRQTVQSIIEAINTANNTDPQVVVSNDKLIAASMDVAELSAITADMGTLTAGKIQKGNNFINLNTSPASMEFKNASTWNSATQGLQFDTQGNLNIKGKVEITSSDTIPTKTEAQGYASTAESNAKGYADGVAATAQKYATAVYGTCTATGASTAAKVVTLDDFKLFTGAQITVKFTNANTAAAPTLNVNSTGAKAIYVNKAVTSTSNPLLWASGAELHFTYDGSYWNCDDVGYGYSTTCSVAATTAAKTGAQTGAIITNGTTVALTCTYANTVEGALTFNFESTGAASIYQHNAITSSSNALVWSAGATVTFVRRGAYWYYVASTTIDGDNIKTGKIKANLGGSYIDLDSGDMLLGDASTYEASTQGLMWDESNGSLKIKGQITVEPGSNVYSKTDADTAIGTAVNGIEIGGRNILVGTAKSVSKATTATSGYVTQSLYYTPFKKTLSELGYKVGDKITLSFDWKITSATTYGNARIEWYGYKDASNTDTYLAALINPFATFSSSYTSDHVETTVTLTSTTVNAKRLIMRIDNSSLTLTISNLKLEKGTKATAWSQAPEDESGINLVPYPYYRDAITTEANKPFSDVGITWTVNADGSITATGTATGDSWYHCATNYDPTNPNGGYCIPAGTYTLSGCPSGGASGTYCIQMNFYDGYSGANPINVEGGTYYVQDVGLGKTFTITTKAFVRIHPVIKNGTVCPSAGYTFYPMLENGCIAHKFVSPNINEGAASTASNYITRIDNGGIYISPANQSPASNAEGNSVKINASGMEVYKGGVSVAQYGDVVRVGREANSYARTLINTGGMQVVQRDSSGTDTTMANIGYGSGNTQSGTTADAPYYTLGRRDIGSTVGNYSVVEGNLNTASGYASHAEGQGTRAVSTSSHSEGHGTNATGWASHAEGEDGSASGEASHAEGFYTTASGYASHAEGSETEAAGNYSHAGGNHTIANGESQTAIGKYNVPDNTSLFIVGNGSDVTSRKNALIVDSNGNAKLKGFVYMNCSNTSTDGINLRNLMYLAGDTLTNLTIDTASYLTSAKTQINLNLSLGKLIAATAFTPTSVTLVTRQNGNYTHGSASSTYVEWTVNACNITASKNLFLQLLRTSDTTNAINNAPIGIVIKISGTFS